MDIFGMVNVDNLLTTYFQTTTTLTTERAYKAPIKTKTRWKSRHY